MKDFEVALKKALPKKVKAYIKKNINHAQGVSKRKATAANNYGSSVSADVRKANYAWQACYDSLKSESIDENLKAARYYVFESSTPSTAAARALSKKLWDVNGPSLATKKEIKNICDVIKNIQGEDFNRVRLTQAAVAWQASDASLAMSVMKDLYPKLNVSEKFSTPVALAAAAYDFGVVDDSWTESCSYAMKKTALTESGFEDILRDKSKKICVVGNSPIEIKSGNGDEIDSHDIVVRFNNFESSNSFRRDYGRKTDVWMRAGGHQDIWRRGGEKFQNILFSGPDRRYHSFNSADVVELALNNSSLSFVPSRVYSELSSDLNYPPSAGILLLYWINKVRGRFSSNGVSAYGFSMEDQGENKSSQYFSNSLKKGSYSHNWRAESIFLEKLMK